MNDMDKMQAEAVNRAREMYSRRAPGYTANGFPSGYNGNIKPSSGGTAERKQGNADIFTEKSNTEKSEKEPNADEKTPSQNVEIEQKDNAVQLNQQSDFLDTILADKEKALIILLIALLNEEKASSSLLLALMYLII